MKVDSIIFDVDGTLWDSTEIVAMAWMEYLGKFEKIKKEITGSQLKKLFGKLLEEIGAEIFHDYPLMEQLRLTTECCRYENDVLRKHPAPLFPGLAQTLPVLARRLPLFIVSNCQAGYIETFLEGTGTAKLFKDHLCPGDTGQAKAANIRRICEKHQLAVPCYVGDTLGDYNACQTAGVPFVHAAYGFGQVPEAAMVLQEPVQLVRLLEEEI